MDFTFLKSTRFWSIVIGAVAVYLSDKGLIGQPEMALVATITGLFVVVGSADSVAKKIGNATVSVDKANVVNANETTSPN